MFLKYNNNPPLCNGSFEIHIISTHVQRMFTIISKVQKLLYIVILFKYYKCSSTYIYIFVRKLYIIILLRHTFVLYILSVYYIMFAIRQSKIPTLD